VHTLKGNCALFGVLSVVALCHDLESFMAENPGSPPEHEVARLRKAWDEVLSTVAHFIGDAPSDKLDVGDDEYAAIVDAIARGVPRREILAAIARWRLEPSERRLQRFAEQAQGVARRLGKELDVDVQSNQVRVSGEVLRPVWSALAHVIRNAIDHGIETPMERKRLGKPAAGRLLLCTRSTEGRTYIDVSDDGRGVDWERVAVKAKAAGLPHATRRDLVEAIFTDGLSTRETASTESGRGVGMAAVREACRTLGGDVEIESTPGAGTLVRCSFSDRAVAGEGASGWVDLPIVESQAPRAQSTG
jgi:two-component system chemotaxis sensor kinase CheA